MNDEITNIPKIRFKGYTEDWEQRKLGELYKERKEKGNNKLPILSVSIHSGVSDSELNSDSLGKDVKRSEDKTLYKRTYSGDLVFNMMRAWQGAIGVVKNEGMVSPAYIVATPNNKIFPGFMNYYFQRKPAIYELNNLSYGVTDFRKRLYWDSFIKAHTIFPSISEQKKISDFFLKIDDTIALHQRELDLLRKTKQTYLQKMFPKAGEDRPEIRFAGFTEPWEQRKLKEGMTEYTDRVYIQENKTYKQVSVKNIGKIVLRGEKRGIQIGRKRQAKVNLTDHPYTLIFTRQTIEQGGIGFAPKETDGAIVTENMPTIDVNNDVIYCNYLMAYVKTEDWYRNVILKNIEGGTAQVAIHEDNILSSEVHLPKIEEQQKIGTFFKQLDDTIALHQRNLNVLKEMKKSLLQQMFV